MIATSGTRARPGALCHRPPRAPARLPARAAQPSSPAPHPRDEPPQPLAAEADKAHVNPITGNPQTGKLVDVYFEVGSLLVVVVLAFASLWNVQHVLKQTGAADQLRAPADRAEWLAQDTKDVYGPCGQGEHGSALEDLLTGKPCHPSEYARVPPASQLKQ